MAQHPRRSIQTPWPSQHLPQLRQLLPCRARILRLLLLPQALEHRVREAHLAPLTPDKRQVRLVEIVGAPSNLERVERDYQHAEPIVPGAVEQRRSELLGLRLRPVQLVPAVAVGIRLGHLLDAARRSRGQDHGDLSRVCGPGSCFFGIWMHYLLHADRRNEDGAFVCLPEELGRHITPRGLHQHAGSQPVALECRAVGGIRALAAGGPEDVEEVREGDGIAGCCFPFLRLGRVLGFT